MKNYFRERLWLVYSMAAALCWRVWGVLAKFISNDISPYANHLMFTIGMLFTIPFVIGKCTSNSNNTNVVYNYNLYFNGAAAVMGANDLIGDPKFVNLSTSLSTANFALNSGSPGINSGTGNLAPSTDINGTVRPKGTGIDRGAYESF